MDAVCRECGNTGVGFDGHPCPCGAAGPGTAVYEPVEVGTTTPTPNYVTMLRSAPGAVPARQGWQCPACRAVYAPWVPGCERCNHPPAFVCHPDPATRAEVERMCREMEPGTVRMHPSGG